MAAREKTKGRIKQLVSSESLGSLLLVNTVYFKGHHEKYFSSPQIFGSDQALGMLESLTRLGDITFNNC